MGAEIVYAGSPATPWDGALARFADGPPAFPAFAGELLDFCSDLSTAISRSPAARRHPELQAFAFSIRRSETLRLRAQFEALAGTSLVLQPRGCVVHFAPSHVDTMFAYSWVWSALLGNRNIVRLSRRRSPVSMELESIVCEHLREAAEPLASATLILSYGHDPDITARLSAHADVRLIWGGDEAARAIKGVPAKPSTLDVGFVDRLSVAILRASAVAGLDESGLDAFAGLFARDLSLDQAVCSSPRTVVWVGREDETAAAATRLWRAVDRQLAARRYGVPPAAAVSKMVAAAALAAAGNVRAYTAPSNRLTVVGLNGLTALDSPPVGWGFLQEVRKERLQDVARLVGQRVQTAVVFGWSTPELRDFVANGRLPGIDRMVPVGDALVFGRYWDGFDLFQTLTRAVFISARADPH